MANVMGKMMGAKYQDVLDNIGAYYYFPLAIAKESGVDDAVLEVRAKAETGSIDRAAGLAFGIKNIGNYFVWRLNALEDNVILFEFVNNKRLKRASVDKPIDSGQWYDLRVEIQGPEIKGYLDDELLLEYTADKPVSGYVGLWTKADSVTYFQGLSIQVHGQTRKIDL